MAVRLPAHQVAGAVQPGTGLLAERVIDETLRRELRAIQVAQGHTVTADVQLTDHPLRHGLLPGVQHIHLGVADRPANRHLRRVRRQFMHFESDREGGGFGRPVAIDQAQPRRLLQQRTEGCGLCTLTAADQHAQQRQGLGDQLHVLVEQRRGQEQYGDALVHQRRRETLRVDQRVVIDHPHLPAVEQCAPDLQGAGIECRVGGEGDTVARRQFGKAVVQHQPRDAPVRDANALGCAGGTGGVHHVGRAPAILGQPRVVAGLVVE
ncbi:hypothetical protein D3C80_1197340 [compost metagenome]